MGLGSATEVPFNLQPGLFFRNKDLFLPVFSLFLDFSLINLQIILILYLDLFRNYLIAC